jgi:hypothetical protein
MTDIFKEVFLGNGVGHSILWLLALAVASWALELICLALGKGPWANFIKIGSLFIGTLMIIRLGLQLVKEVATALGLL